VTEAPLTAVVPVEFLTVTSMAGWNTETVLALARGIPLLDA